MGRLALAVALALLMAGCAHEPASYPASKRPSEPIQRQPSAPPPSAGVRRPATAGERIAALARRMIGTPYRYGGQHPTEGFDCSGLVYYTHGAVGLAVPRVSRDQYRRARKVSLAEAEPGDIIFFSDAAKLSHVAIYLGNGRFVHAPSSGRTVSEADLNAPYYRSHLVGIGRLHER